MPLRRCSISLDENLLTTVDAFGAARRLDRSKAVRQLLHLGLQALSLPPGQLVKLAPHLSPLRQPETLFARPPSSPPDPFNPLAMESQQP